MDKKIRLIFVLMAKSKTNKDRKQNLLKYKKTHKRKKPMTQELDPNVIQSPTWAGDSLIEMYGAEWEAVFNFINAVGPAYAAANSIMNRNVLNGSVQMKYEKQNPETGELTPLTEEEQAPYKAKFEDMIKRAKDIAAQAVASRDGVQNVDEEVKGTEELEPPSQEGLPVIDAIVDPNGNPVKSDNKGENPLRAV